MNSVKQVQVELAAMRIRMRQIERLLQLQGLTTQQTSPAGIQSQQAQRIPLQGSTYYLDGNGDAYLKDVFLSGWAQLGNAPGIKSKVISGSIAATPVNLAIAHGLADRTKIVSWSMLVDQGTYMIPPNVSAGLANVEYEDAADGTNIYFLPVNASNLGSKTCYVHVFYKA